MRLNFLVGVIIGILLIYVSIFGLVIPGLFALTGTPENYLTYTAVQATGNPMTITAYEVTHVVSRLIGKSTYLYADKGAGYFGDFTHTFDFKVTSAVEYSDGNFWALSDKIGDGLTIKGGNIEAGWISEGIGSILFYFRYWIDTNNAIATTIILSTNVWYYPKITRSGALITCTIYSDSARTMPTGSPLTFNLPLSSLTFRYVYATQSVNDQSPLAYSGTQVVANLNLGGTTPPPTTGTIHVFTTYNATYVAVDVTVTSSFPTQYGTTTTDSNNPLKFTSLSAGTYTVSGTYNSVYKSTSVTLSGGDTKDATLNFGGSTPPPPPPDWWEQIVAFFNKPSVKSLMLLVGIALTGICGIVTFVPSKHHAAPYPYY